MPAIEIRLATMRLSDGQQEHYPQIVCEGRVFETRRYFDGFKNRAQYEVDELRHVLLGEEKPDPADPKYADTMERKG